MQGLTEFLPVSSSGHLVILQHLFGIEEPPLLLDTILHLGTLAAVFVVFRGDLWAMIRALQEPIKKGPAAAWRENGSFRLIGWIILGTIPAGVAGVLLADFFEGLFASTHAVGLALFVTAAVLFSGRLVRGTGEPLEKAKGWQALGVGLAQAVAIVPGISRSGSTIIAALHLGLDRDAAGRFSFLLAIPAILGAVLLQALKIEIVPPGFVAAAVIGFVVAAVSGYLALNLLLRFVRGGRLHYFGFYCVAAGIFALML
jgi:undecaprenyl-diphosphatase